MTLTCSCDYSFDIRNIDPIGIQYGPTGPGLILYNCPRCGSTRSINWWGASQEVKQEALAVQEFVDREKHGTP